jgi:hypothetical protein
MVSTSSGCPGWYSFIVFDLVRCMVQLIVVLRGSFARFENSRDSGRKSTHVTVARTRNTTVQRLSLFTNKSRASRKMSSERHWLICASPCACSPVTRGDWFLYSRRRFSLYNLVRARNTCITIPTVKQGCEISFLSIFSA